MIHIDFETRGKVDLRKCGARRYAEDPDTDILCLAFKIDENPIDLWVPGEVVPDDLTQAISSGATVSAFGVHFESAIWDNIAVPRYGFPPVKHWKCIAAKVAAHALPRKLEQVAKALNLKEQKDMAGSRVMMKLAKPKKKGGWHETAKDLNVLYDYCVQDVSTECAVDEAVRDLSHKEHEIWSLDQKINTRGITVDSELVNAALKMIEEHTEVLSKELTKLTDGQVTSATERDSLLFWFDMHGFPMEDLTKGTVASMIENAPPRFKRILEIRQETGKTSTAKYQAFKNAVCKDGRVRNLLLYHGASTGRWCMPGGAEVLTQNGWVCLDQWNASPIIQWDDRGRLTWCQKPSKHQFAHNGDMYRIESLFVDGLFTSEHRIVYHDKNKKLRVSEIAKLPISRPSFIVSGRKEDATIPGIQTRLWVMLQADGHLCTDTAQGRFMRFHFKKERKIRRCEALLTDAGIPFKSRKYACGTQIVIRWVDIPDYLREKHFSSRLLQHDPQVFLSELVFWDSRVNIDNSENGFEFTTVCPSDAEWAATMAHLGGMAATINVRKQRNKNWKTSYRVYIRDRQSASIRKKPELQAYRGMVYCPQTDTGFFLVRYHGKIHVTGNSGMLVQPQNFPRDKFKDPEPVIEDLKSMSYARFSKKYPVMETLSKLLRPCFIASPDHTLYGGDYNAIEARVLFWLAEDERALNTFRKGEDIYADLARVIYASGEISKEQRDLGKRGILGCGYGMGAKKFKLTCETYGTPITEELSERVIDAYRSRYYSVVRFWYDQEAAAVEAVRTGRPVRAGKILWAVHNRYLYCRLPSGRCLAYYSPEVRTGETPWGEKKAQLSFMAVNSVTRKWERDRTYGGKIVENITQAVARDLMAHAMIECEKVGYKMLLSVHDELITERRADGGFFKDLETVMTDLPAWAEGLPVKAETWANRRYCK